MRQCFFYQGKPLKTLVGQFVLTQSKLDSHHYALERIQNSPNNYVFQYYSSFEDNHFLRYYTCWEQEESVAKKVQKQKQQNIDKGPKKKSMGLASFLSKKKAEISDPPMTKFESNKSKKQIEQKKQQVTKVKALYVQLQGFEKLAIPNQIQEVKQLMALIYILSRTVQRAHKIWPNMIAVQASDGNLRFVKKGTNRDQQLVNLFLYAIKDKPIQLWSKQMISIYEMYKINGEIQLLGSRIHHDLSIILSAEYEITVVNEGKKKQDKVKIVEPQTILLVESGRRIQISQYIVSFSYIDENTRQITLEHYVESQLVLIGQSNNFIVRYLKTFRIK